MGSVLIDAELSDIQDLFAVMRDLEKYPNVRPEPEPVPLGGELRFLVHCSSCHTGNGEGSNPPRYGDVTGASASLINNKIQTIPKMHHLKPGDPAQAASLEEIDAIAEFLKR